MTSLTLAAPKPTPTPSVAPAGQKEIDPNDINEKPIDAEAVVCLIYSS